MSNQPGAGSQRTIHRIVEGARNAVKAIRDRVTGRKQKYLKHFMDGLWYFLNFGQIDEDQELGWRWILEKYPGVVDLALDEYKEGGPAELAAVLAADKVLINEIESLSDEERLRLKETITTTDPLSTKPAPVDIDIAFWGLTREAMRDGSPEGMPEWLRRRDDQPLVRAILVFWRNTQLQMARAEEENKTRALTLEMVSKDVAAAILDPTSTDESRAYSRLHHAAMKLFDESSKSH